MDNLRNLLDRDRTFWMLATVIVAAGIALVVTPPMAVVFVALSAVLQTTARACSSARLKRQAIRVRPSRR